MVSCRQLSGSHPPLLMKHLISDPTVQTSITALLGAEFPLIITANAGRNPATVLLLSQLARPPVIIVRLSAALSALSFPGNHLYFLGNVFISKVPHLNHADLVILLDVDCP